MKLIAPYYVQKERGRKLIPLETMLRMYLMQNEGGLFGEGIEVTIYDSYAMKHFLKIDFSTEQNPDATTSFTIVTCSKNTISPTSFSMMWNSGWVCRDSSCTAGRLVDAAIIHVLSSTKKATKLRDPKMYSTKKGNQWFFGIKILSGMDAGTGYVHTIIFCMGRCRVDACG